MPGTYYILYPLVISPWTTITGYSNISDNSALGYLGNTTIMPVTGFTNVHGPTDPAAWPVSSAILMIDSASGGYGILSAGQNITGINVDCSDAPAGTNGITLYNAVYGASISEFSILEAPNVGLMAQFASSQVDGLHVYHGLVSRCGRSIDLNVADAVFDDVNGTGALTDHNWYIRNAVDSIFSNCRGGNAAIHNWYFAVNQTATGSYCLLEGCGSDLADSYGMLIDYGNTGGIWLNIVGFSSDQDNAGATTGAIRIASAPQPVEFEGLTINTTANYGLQYLNSASLVVASAIINAAVSAFSNGGGNGTVLINSNAILGIDWNYIGTAGQPAFLNGWSNFGSGNANLAFMQEGNGIKITGVVMGGTASPVFTLPAGLRPVSDQFIWGYNITTGAACALSVNTGGTCALQGALAADEYVFNGKIDLAI
jgi:hypothetical protein